MKTFTLGLIFIGFTFLMQAQNDMAYVDINSNENIKPSKKEAINSNYYNFFDTKISSERIRNFQKLVANYDIKSSSIYSSNATSDYTVVFTEGDNKISAQFNQSGKIVECKELFKDIKLPYVISSDIAKNYPGWKFSQVSCEISYTQNNDEQIIYKVAIENGNKKKNLKIDATVYIP